MQLLEIDTTILKKMVTTTGEDLDSLSRKSPILVVFLRHFGCVFCKEALNDLADLKDHIKSKGFDIVFIHMSDEEVANKYFDQYKLSNSLHISDKDAQYYAAFGITKGGFSQLYGLNTWIRGFSASKKGHNLEMAANLGDSTQMPGIFVLKDGVLVNSFIHKKASDRPDYSLLLEL